MSSAVDALLEAFQFGSVTWNERGPGEGVRMDVASDS